jgi:hypothetical protein
LARRFDAVEDWHSDVHEDHVGSGLKGNFHGFGTICGFANNFKVIFGVDERCEAGANQHLVICKHDADYRLCSISHDGSRAG